MQQSYSVRDFISEVRLDSLLESPFSKLTKQLQKPTTEHSESVLKQLRLYKIEELSLDDSTPPREALENVFASIDITGGNIVYLLDGREDGVDIYFGTLSSKKTDSVSTGRALEHALKGNFSGIELQNIKVERIKKQLEKIGNAKQVGMLLGVPTFNKRECDERDYQGIDRVISGMLGDCWQLLVVADPGSTSEIREMLDSLYSLSSTLHLMSKQTIQSAENKSHNTSETRGKSDSSTVTESLGKSSSSAVSTSLATSASKTEGSTNSSGSSSSSSGTSDSRTTGDSKTEGTSKTVGENSGESTARGETWNVSHSSADTTGSGTTVSFEHTNKKFAEVVKHLDETLLPRFQLGRAKAMFKTAIYVFADKREVLTRAGGLLRALFQGDDSHFTPVEFKRLAAPLNSVDSYFAMQETDKIDRHLCCLHSIPIHDGSTTVATWLTTRELSLIAGLPVCEMPGLRLRKSVDFGVNISTAETVACNGIELGNIKLRGRELENNSFVIDQKMLNGHVFVTGVTGAGKTKTCQRLLLESHLPFMVLEPAKTEYRDLLANDPSILFFTPGDEKLAPFRFNPFELLKGEALSGHIDMLKAAFTASFPMEAAMPHLIEQALVSVYTDAGWDIHRTANFRFEGREWESNGQCWPVLDEFLDVLSKVIDRQGLGKELEEKYRGSLNARLRSLLVGAKGRMLNTRNSLDFFKLLERKVVIELEEIRDEGDKALLMGLIVGRLAEAMKINHKQNKSFQHLTLIEEAHRLLSRTSGHTDDPRSHAVGLFTNLLAEVRKYGEGLIIADQIPNKLAPEVIKNTNTKIVHRLFARDDKDAIGDAMGFEDEQKDFLSNLSTGEAIAFCGGWHKPVRVKIKKLDDTDGKNGYEETIMTNACQHRWEECQKLFPWFSRSGEDDVDKNLLGDLLNDGEQIIEHTTYLLNKEYAASNKRDHQLRFKTARNKICGLSDQYGSDVICDMLVAMLLYLIPVARLEESLRNDAKVHIYNLLGGILQNDIVNFKKEWIDNRESQIEVNETCEAICETRL